MQKHVATRIAVSTYASILSLFRREFTNARDVAERLIAESSESGYPALNAWARMLRSCAASRTEPDGDWLDDMRIAIADSNRLWGRFSSSTWNVMLADACLAQGEVAQLHQT
ncbi:MAG: hypothetical protein QGF53_07645 [Alphaproteobacteria bacterium]|nr:hypothetical protein [Alphaproteobacteria bacterium]